MDLSLVPMVGALVAGLVIGGLVAWFDVSSRLATAHDKGKDEGDAERTALLQQLTTSHDELAQLRLTLSEREEATASMQNELEAAHATIAALSTTIHHVTPVPEQLARVREELRAISKHLHATSTELTHATTDRRRLQDTLAPALFMKHEQLADDKHRWLAHTHEELNARFKSVLVEILDERTKQAAELNEADLSAMLDSLKARLATFTTEREQPHTHGSMR